MKAALAGLATALALATLVLAYCMAFPARWDGIGKLGALALAFPLHLLVATLAAALLATFARLLRARLACALFLAAAALSAALALVPALALWREARLVKVPLSLGTYLENATHVNAGEPQRQRSVVYGTTADGAKLELDVWRSGLPDTGPLRPAIVIVHGGAWSHGTRSMTPDWDRWLASLGYEVFDVEYRLPPPVRWLDEVGDVNSALGWLATHAEEYHVDPTRISVMGASAGANLALLAAYSAGDPALPPSTPVPPVAVSSVIDVYGPSDLARLYRECPSADYLRPLLRGYVGGTPEELPERYHALSPLEHVTTNAPPTLVLLGTSDRLVAPDHATRLRGALAKAGVPHEVYLLPATDHGFDANWGGFATQIARAKIEAFLKRYTER